MNLSMKTHIQEPEALVPWNLNFLYYNFPFLRTGIMKISTFQAFCTVLLTWSAQFKLLHKIIPKYLQLLASGILWSSPRIV
jgi:hypothetical protein